MRKERRSAFSAPSPPCSLAGRPQERAEIDRFIWIGKVDLSPQKTCFLPNQMTNEPIDLLFTIQGAQCPLSAHDGPHNGRVSEVYHHRSPLTDSSPGCRTLTTVLYVQPVVMSSTQMLFPISRKMTNKVDFDGKSTKEMGVEKRQEVAQTLVV